MRIDNPFPAIGRVFSASTCLATCLSSLGYAAPDVTDGSFEKPSLAASALQYDAKEETVWVFAPQGGSGGSGIASNGSLFQNGTAPEGKQVAFLQNKDGEMRQAVVGFEAGKTYTLSYFDQGRISGANPYLVRLDDQVIVPERTPESLTEFNKVTATFAVTSSDGRALVFKGLGKNGKDVTTFIDDVQLTEVAVSNPDAPKVSEVILNDVKTTNTAPVGPEQHPHGRSPIHDDQSEVKPNLSGAKPEQSEPPIPQKMKAVEKDDNWDRINGPVPPHIIEEVRRGFIESYDTTLPKASAELQKLPQKSAQRQQLAAEIRQLRKERADWATKSNALMEKYILEYSSKDELARRAIKAEETQRADEEAKASEAKRLAQAEAVQRRQRLLDPAGGDERRQLVLNYIVAYRQEVELTDSIAASQKQYDELASSLKFSENSHDLEVLKSRTRLMELQLEVQKQQYEHQNKRNAVYDSRNEIWNDLINIPRDVLKPLLNAMFYDKSLLSIQQNGAHKLHNELEVFWLKQEQQ